MTRDTAQAVKRFMRMICHTPFLYRTVKVT